MSAMALRIAGSLGWRSVCMVRCIRMVSHQLSCAVLATNSSQLTTMNVSRAPSKSCKSASAPFSTHNNHHKHDLFFFGGGEEAQNWLENRLYSSVKCSPKCIISHKIPQKFSGEGDTPSPDRTPLGAYGASIPRLRRLDVVPPLLFS